MDTMLQIALIRPQEHTSIVISITNGESLPIMTTTLVLVPFAYVHNTLCDILIQNLDLGLSLKMYSYM